MGKWFGSSVPGRTPTCSASEFSQPSRTDKPSAPAVTSRQRRHRRPGGLEVGADHDAVGPHEVGHRSAFLRRPMLRAATNTYCRSAEPSSSGGVPTAMNCSVCELPSHPSSPRARPRKGHLGATSATGSRRGAGARRLHWSRASSEHLQTCVRSGQLPEFQATLNIAPDIEPKSCKNELLLHIYTNRA